MMMMVVAVVLVVIVVVLIVSRNDYFGVPALFCSVSSSVSSSHDSCTICCTRFSYSRLFSRKSCAASLFAGLFGFGSCKRDLKRNNAYKGWFSLDTDREQGFHKKVKSVMRGLPIFFSDRTCCSTGVSKVSGGQVLR